MSSINRREYISGFDLIKLFGSCLVAASHSFLNRLVENLGINAPEFLGQLIAVFFIMAGFLFAGSIDNCEEPKRYIRKYIVKYTVLYYLTLFATQIIHYCKLWHSSGVFMYKDFIYVLAVMPYLNIGTSIQLWFIPPLLAGIGISGFVKIKRLGRIYTPILLFFTILTVVITTWSGYLSVSLQSLYSSNHLLIFLNFMSRFIEGAFCVWCGVILYDNYRVFMRLRMSKVVVFAILFSTAEIFFYLKSPQRVPVIRIFPASLLLWSVILMRPILSINMSCLKKWHREITVFSGLMYFLHIGEAQLLGRIINNSILNFLIYTTFNVFLTFFICQVIMTRKGTDK